MAHAGLLLRPHKARHFGEQRAQPGIPAHGRFRTNPPAKVYRGDVAHNVDMINGVDAVAARGELLEVRPLRNIVSDHHSLRRIVTQDFFRGGPLKIAGEAGVSAFSESNQIPARGSRGAENRGRDQTEGERTRAAPLIDQVVAHGCASAQRHGLARESSMRRDVENLNAHSGGAYSSTRMVTSSRITPPSLKRSRAASSAECSPAALSRKCSRAQVRRPSVPKNSPSPFSVSVRPSL